MEVNNLSQDEKKVSENEIALEIVKLYHENYFYRHTNFWNLVNKSLFAILGLLSLPYFIHSGVKYEILFIFPILSIIICFFSILLLESEAIRMILIKMKLENLLEKDVSMSKVNYTEYKINLELRSRIEKKKKYRKNGKLSCYGKLIERQLLNIDENDKFPIWENFIMKSITKNTSFLYILLIIVSIVELYFIISKGLFY
jgi:hypothetical protein